MSTSFPQEHLQVQKIPPYFFCVDAIWRTVRSPNTLPSNLCDTALLARSLARHPQLAEPPYRKLRSRTYRSVPHEQRHSQATSPFVFVMDWSKTVQRPICVSPVHYSAIDECPLVVLMKRVIGNRAAEIGGIISLSIMRRELRRTIPSKMLIAPASPPLSYHFSNRDVNRK